MGYNRKPLVPVLSFTVTHTIQFKLMFTSKIALVEDTAGLPRALPVWLCLLPSLEHFQKKKKEMFLFVLGLSFYV